MDEEQPMHDDMALDRTYRVLIIFDLDTMD